MFPDKLKRGLISLIVPCILFTSGCSGMIKKALISKEKPISLVGTKFELSAKEQGYKMLKECKQERESQSGIRSRVLYREKFRTAIEFLQEVNDPNTVYFAKEYLKEFPDSAIDVMKGCLEKEKYFKNKK